MKFNWLIILLSLITISFVFAILGYELFLYWVKENKCCKNTNNFKKCFPSTRKKYYKSMCLINNEGRCCGSDECQNIKSFDKCIKNYDCNWQKSEDKCKK
jgi:hypothetical protein